MYLKVSIYKEKLEKNYRMMFLPSGRNEEKMILTKDYGVVSYLSEKYAEKIGELILFALSQSDEGKIEEIADVKFRRKFFVNTNRIDYKYNMISFIYYQGYYYLKMNIKDKTEYLLDEEKYDNKFNHTFKEKPKNKELGEKVMEMFKYKEKYDNAY